MSATRTEAVTASEHLGMLNSSLEFVNQKLHNNLTRPLKWARFEKYPDNDIILIKERMNDGVFLETIQSAAERGGIRAVQLAAHLYPGCTYCADHLQCYSISQAAGASSGADSAGDSFFNDWSGSI